MRIRVPKLSEHEVIVPGSLFLVFEIDVTGHANNFLVQNVSRALVDKLRVKFGGTVLQDTLGYDIYKIFEDLFLTVEARKNVKFEGIQSVDLCKIRSNVGDTKSSGVDLENKLAAAYKNKYRIHLDQQIVTDHGVFYPYALSKDLIFEVTLAPTEQVVRGSDPAKLAYELKNIQLQYETIRSEKLAEEATSMYTHEKEFAFDNVLQEDGFTFEKGTQEKNQS